jgi:membrane protein implicated in regulation of membrane protease activity
VSRPQPSGERPPKRHYRDSALLYLSLAAIVVVVAWAIGGSWLRAFAFAVAFLLATAWSWWRWSQRFDKGRAAAKTSGR